MDRANNMAREFKRSWAMAGIILLGLLMRVGYTSLFYGPQLDLNYPSDYWEYRRAANQILAGDWAFTDGVFLERPPLFPIMMAVVGGQKPLILMLNQLLSVIVIPLTYVLARRFQLPASLAFLAAALIALDPTSIKYAGILMAEPLANLLLALAYVCLIFAMRSDDRRALVTLCALAGSFIALSALTRPSAYLLWIPLGLWIAVSRPRLRLLALASLVAPAFLGVGAWRIHNSVTYDNSNFSSVGSFNLLYHRAANVLRLADGLADIELVHEELTRRVAEALGALDEDLPSDWSEIRQYYRGISSAEESALAEAALEIFRQHPLHYVLTIPVGMYWILLSVYGELYWLSIVWNAALLLAAALGVWQLSRQRAWASLAFLLLPSLYFLSAALLVCTNCIDTRARTMITPLLAVMAAYGIMHIVNRRRAASAPPSPPAGS